MKSYNDFSIESISFSLDRSFKRSLVYRCQPDDVGRKMIRSNSSFCEGESKEKIRKIMFGKMKIIVPPFSAREILDDQPGIENLVNSMKNSMSPRFENFSSQRCRRISKEHKKANLLQNKQ